METPIVTKNEFIQRYWKYYLMLENDFLETEQYLAIDELNYRAFSNEYIKQYQAICSEIDVIAKSYCKELDNDFRGNHINAYCKCITDNNSDFINRKIKLQDKGMEVFPWKDWTYDISTQTNGTPRVNANNPDWWQKYNKIKHDRTTINNETGLPYYKLANQENVLQALAALFQLELYYFRKLHQVHFPIEADVPDPPSKLFVIEDWGSSWIVFGNGMQIKMMGAEQGNGMRVQIVGDE